MNRPPLITLPLLLLGLTLTALYGRVAAAPVAALSESEMLGCERRLTELGYWLSSADGRADESTVAAVTAFRRVQGYFNTGSPNAADLPALESATPLQAESGGGTR